MFNFHSELESSQHIPLHDYCKCVTNIVFPKLNANCSQFYSQSQRVRMTPFAAIVWWDVLTNIQGGWGGSQLYCNSCAIQEGHEAGPASFLDVIELRLVWKLHTLAFRKLAHNWTPFCSIIYVDAPTPLSLTSLLHRNKAHYSSTAIGLEELWALPQQKQLGSVTPRIVLPLCC